MLNKMKGYNMDNFDKWFLIFMVVISLLGVFLFAYWLGYSFNELIQVGK